MIQAPIQTVGSHPNTAALMHVLAAQGVIAPHTGKPLSEALILGVGGGLGAGYILFEFKRQDSAGIVTGFRNRWNYAAEHLTTLCERLGTNPTMQETASAKAAAANLNAAVERGVPFIAWVDKAHLPYQQHPESLQGYGSHVVGVYGMEGDNVVVDDVAHGLFRVPAEIFAAGRARIGSDKNRLLLVDAPQQMDLPAAVTSGIQDHVEHLGRDSESFALPVYKKWAKLLTDTKNKKGWQVVFKTRRGLYKTLRSVFEHITLDGTDGSALRGMYADFLDEAAVILNKPALQDVSAQYRAVAARWVEFAEAALPDSVPAFVETKTLMRQRYALYRTQKLDERRAVMDRLAGLETEYFQNFPMNAPDVSDLFVTLQTKLNAIYDGEVQALAALSSAI